MEEEQKQLLLKNLYIRLSYGFIVHRYSDNVDIKINTIDDFSHFLEYSNDEKFKPYLRSMSSMTEEEKRDILQLLNIHGDIDNEGNLLLGVECNIINLKVCKKYIEELNKRMFDIYHMIEKGLALEAPKGMYD